MIDMANMGMLSPDGISHSFDDRANGYARGEGFAVVIIKRLDDALKHGDTIRGIIRATGSNQDGKTPGISQPSGAAQERLIRDTYGLAGLDLSLTRYFEAHGTGTQVGDPTEARAVATAFKNCRPSGSPLYVGSVKTNIGHLEGTSGLASLIKTILILEKGLIPPNIWFQNINPKIRETEWNIKVISRLHLLAIACLKSTDSCRSYSVASQWTSESIGEFVWIRRLERACSTRRCLQLSRSPRTPRHSLSFFVCN